LAKLLDPQVLDPQCSIHPVRPSGKIISAEISTKLRTESPGANASDTIEIEGMDSSEGTRREAYALLVATCGLMFASFHTFAG